MSEFKIGQLRVWWTRFDENHLFYNVPNPDVACGVLFGLAMADLDNSHVTMNAGGLEVYEEGEDGPQWCEWYDEETGEDIFVYTQIKYPKLEGAE